MDRARGHELRRSAKGSRLRDHERVRRHHVSGEAMRQGHRRARPASSRLECAEADQIGSRHDTDELAIVDHGES